MFSTDFAYDNSTIILIGDVYCPNAKCLCKLCQHKKTFQSFGRSDYQCTHCGSLCQVRNIPFADQTNSFFLSLGQGVYIFEERPKSIQEIIGDVYCPGEFCLRREMRIYWWLCNNSEIHLWLCKVWRLVVCSQSAFHVTRARKDDKNRQNTLFLCQKRWNPPDEQVLPNVPFQSTKCGKKELCVDNIKAIGDVY